MKAISDKMKTYIDGKLEEQMELIRALAPIPSPSNQEEQRAKFCRDYLVSKGLDQTYIDCENNVICGFNLENAKRLAIFAGHTDVVFPDLTPLPYEEKDGKIYCPGIMDDTINAAAVMLMARMVKDLELAPKDPDLGLLFVMDTGEEGLGRLHGIRQIFKDFGDRAECFFTFDGDYGVLATDAVGAHRYGIEFRTEGGHSYGAFGNKSAIHYMAAFINRLCEVELPTEYKTTYNVGLIEGGTSVNSIAQYAKMVYEYRSVGANCLAFMKNYFETCVEEFRAKGIDISIEVIDERPCRDPECNNSELADFAFDVMKSVSGIEPEIVAMSTDGNIPLSMGIPAVCVAACRGAGSHTRGEWAEIASIPTGLEIAAAILSEYTK